MITHLRISNFALLEEIEIDFSKGLSLFTGETGTGKSILIDAICRVLGSRATQDDVRMGASKSVLEVVFDTANFPPDAEELLKAWQIDLQDGELILRREIQSSGKSRALINNCTVTLQQLRELAPCLVDVFGQNEHQSLLDSESQRALYDESIGILLSAAELSEIAFEIRMLQEEYRSLREREQQRQRNIDMLQFQIREIEEAHLSESEEQELVSKKALLQNAERIHSVCEALLSDILENERNLTGLMETVSKHLTELEKYKEDFALPAAKLVDWQENLRELVREIDVLNRSLDFEQASLDELESRLDLVQRLKKKYGPTLKDVLQHLERSRQELDLNLNTEEREAEVVRETRKKVERYCMLASEISCGRRAAREVFEKKVEKELKQIALEKCRFRVSALGEPVDTVAIQDEDLMRQDFPVNGWESIHFQIEPNPGEGFRDLSRIASGGELSRLMLALKVVTQGGSRTSCLIFDEIDAGIGGRTAYQIGERLKRLARHSQVLCVTHLPQVAAFGDHHFQVQKKLKDHRTITVVDELRDQGRIQELARMLSGSEITEAALRHARELREQVEAGTP